MLSRNKVFKLETAQLEADLEKEFSTSEFIADAAKTKRVKSLSFIEDLEGDIIDSKGKINWWWAILNIGKIVARIVFAIKVSKSTKGL